MIEAINFLENSKINVFTDKKILDNHQFNYKENKNINFDFDINLNILKNADCVMTDVFNSMNDKEDKEFMLKKFQVNKDIMSNTKSSTVFMHCLPAKIGSEVTQEVIKGPQSITLKQAQNRMVAQRGILKWLDL